MFLYKYLSRQRLPRDQNVQAFLRTHPEFSDRAQTPLSRFVFQSRPWLSYLSAGRKWFPSQPSECLRRRTPGLLPASTGHTYIPHMHSPHNLYTYHTPGTHTFPHSSQALAIHTACASVMHRPSIPCTYPTPHTHSYVPLLTHIHCQSHCTQKSHSGVSGAEPLL